MKHIIIQIESVMKYPPTLSLLNILRGFGHDVILCTSSIDEKVKALCLEKGIQLRNTGYAYSPKNSAIEKMIKIPLIKRGIKRVLEEGYDQETVVWVMTSISLKYLGSILNNKRYIMYMFELSQEIRYYPGLSFLKVNLEKLFQGASAVIECEYNRAHIAKAWFGLQKLPFIVPNKPYMDRLDTKMSIGDKHCADVIEGIKNRTIIIYQGIIDLERPLEPFIDAIADLGDEYALVIMSSDVEKIKHKAKKNTYLLPFVTPPGHLEITSWANIGILTYLPVRGETTSPLNAVYCAPNKIFEYAMFGIPMIGNDIPGLTTEFTKDGIGVSFENFCKEDIIVAIRKIMSNYDYYKRNSYEYYLKTDNIETFRKILQEVDREK